MPTAFAGDMLLYFASFSSASVIFEQISIIYALPKLFIASFTLILPFSPSGTSERMEDEGDVATAFALARILSNIPISRGGPSSLVIYDIMLCRRDSTLEIQSYRVLRVASPC